MAAPMQAELTSKYLQPLQLLSDCKGVEWQLMDGVMGDGAHAFLLACFNIAKMVGV